MKLNETPMNEIGKPAIKESENVKLKELANTLREAGGNIKEAPDTRLKHANEAAARRLEKQREVPKHAKQEGKIERFQHSLNPEMNKGSDVSFGSCASFCQKTRTDSGKGSYSSRGR